MRLNRERAIVRVILAEERLTSVVIAIQAACAEHAISEVCHYSQPVTRAITYVPEPENGTASAPLRSPRSSPRA